MSDEKIQVEGASLEEALHKASKALGVERNAVAFEYDREHLASGATTVKIKAWTGPMRAESPEGRDANRDTGGEPRGEARPEGPRGEGRGRRDDRGGGRFGGRGRDDRGGGDRGRFGGDRPRGDRGSRGPGGGDRRRGEWKPPEKDPARDERLREQARELARKVLAGEPTQEIADLNSYERHLVHTAVAEIGGLETRSIGDQLRKTVQILKKQGDTPAQ